MLLLFKLSLIDVDVGCTAWSDKGQVSGVLGWRGISTLGLSVDRMCFNVKAAIRDPHV